MPYLYDKVSVEEMQKDRLFAPRMTIPPGTKLIEVWCSSIADPGDDWTEFVFTDVRGRRLGTARMAGY